MLTFLPAQQKKLVRFEYFARFATALFFALAILGFFAALFLIPYISFIKSQANTSASRLAFLENSSQTKDSQTFRAALNTLRGEANRLLPAKSVMPYELIAKLNSLVTPGIALSSVTYGLNSDGSAALSVSGLAATRESLQAFVASLQAAPGFSGVNVPVSAFAQDKNISFGLSMQVALPTN